MAINPKKHVVPHKHIIGDIVDGVTSNFTGGLIGGGGTGGGGYSGGMLNISSGHLPLDPIELINYTWEWVNGKWTPHTKHIPTGDSYLKISDSKLGLATDVFLILVDTDPGLPVDSFDRYGPILGVSTGMMVKKDISCGGFVGANQGIIALGSCLQNSFDPPGAWMLHSEYKRINFKGTSFPANPREGWRVIRTDELLGTLGAVDPVYSYQIYERQGSSWVKVGGLVLIMGMSLVCLGPTGVIIVGVSILLLLVQAIMGVFSNLTAALAGLIRAILMIRSLRGFLILLRFAERYIRCLCELRIMLICAAPTSQHTTLTPRRMIPMGWVRLTADGRASA